MATGISYIYLYCLKYINVMEITSMVEQLTVDADEWAAFQRFRSQNQQGSDSFVSSIPTSNPTNFAGTASAETIRELENVDIPDRIKQSMLWSLVSKQLQLTAVEDIVELESIRSEIHDIIRVACWRYDMSSIPYSDRAQIEWFACQILLRKSINRGERVLLATQIMQSQAIDQAANLPPSGGRKAEGLMGYFKKSIGMR